MTNTNKETKKMSSRLARLIERYENTGRCVFIYPRKKEVSLDGHRAMNYKNALTKLVDFFKDQ